MKTENCTVSIKKTVLDKRKLNCTREFKFELIEISYIRLIHSRKAQEVIEFFETHRETPARGKMVGVILRILGNFSN